MGRGRAPCCDKSKVKKGPWTPAEDFKLVSFIQNHGHPNWRSLPQQAGLLRCGKSCRLRWINYLRPEVKRGNWTPEEEENIIRLHRKLGNKWSKIASELPGRTDNEIKNVWNTHLKKRLLGHAEKENDIDATDTDGGSNGKDLQMNRSLGFSHSPASSSSTTSIFSCVSDGDMSHLNQDDSEKHVAIAAHSHHNLATDLYLQCDQNYTNTDLAFCDDIIQEDSIQDTDVSTLDSYMKNNPEITTKNSSLTICPSPPDWASIDDPISNELSETLTQTDTRNQNQNDTPANCSHTNIFWSTVLDTITSTGVCNLDGGDNIQLLQHSQLLEDSQSPTCNHHCGVGGGDEVRYEEWLRYMEHELGLVENCDTASKQSPSTSSYGQDQNMPTLHNNQ